MFFGSLLFIPLSNIYTQTIIVTPNNFHQTGWEEEQINNYPTGQVLVFSTPYVEIVCGSQEFMDYLHGSVQMMLPKQQDPTLRRIRLRNNKFDGTLLADIATQRNHPGCLQFSTFITKNRNGSAPDLVLQIDKEGNGDIDYNIVFSPTIQHQVAATNSGPSFDEVTNYTWQTWDAASGWWSIGLNEPLPAGLNELFTLSQFLQLFPDARIRNSRSGENIAGGIRFTIGGDNSDQDNFVGYIDGFRIAKRINRNTVKCLLFDFKFPDPSCRFMTLPIEAKI